MSMPSFDMFKSGPSTEVLRIELEPPGADARTSQGQTCRTPCELTVPTDNELAVTVQMTGYQPQTLPVRVDGKGGDSRLQPNPVYVELQPAAPVKPARPAPVAKKKTSAASPPPARAQTQTSDPNADPGRRAASKQRRLSGREPGLSVAAGAAIAGSGCANTRGHPAGPVPGRPG